MKRALGIGVLAVLAFAIILLVRLPASWLASALPAGASCDEITGTVWNGSCSALSWQNAALGDLTWKLHPGGLLSRTLATHLALSGAAGTVTAEVEARSEKNITARNLRADVALDPRLLRVLPPDLRGHANADLTLLRVQDGAITAVEGRIEVHDLEQRGPPPAKLGDYLAVFAPGGRGDPVGDLRSTQGPLDIEGKLHLTREPGFVLEGLVAPRADAPPQLLRELGGLGTPDAQGRRPFSVAGTF